MSTYLVAYVISNFKTINSTTEQNILIEVSARPEAIDSNDADFALEESKLILEFFIDYFNVDFPLTKLSELQYINKSNKVYLFFNYSIFKAQIAIPDFNSEAMENWGLGIYKIIYEPD